MQKHSSFGFIRLLVFCALLAAMSIVLGKYLAFNVGSFIRLSLENLPIIFAGVAFGPFAGVAVGVVADLVGCLLVGYEINPLVTAGAAAIGLISGVYHVFFKRTESPVALVLAVMTAHLVGSVVIKSIGLAAYYAMPLPMVFLWRGLNYLIVGAAESFAVYKLISNRGIKNRIRGIVK